MSYNKQNWANGSIGNTPLSAARLNHLEDGLEDAATTADLAYIGAGSAASAAAAAQAAIDALISKATIVNLLDTGAVGNGTTDDQPAIQAAVDAAAAGTIFYIPPRKRFRLKTNGLKWKPSIGIFGDGDSSVLAPDNDGPFASGHSAIYNYTDGSVGSPLTDCFFANFAIDGADITTTGYDVGAKGINILYMERARFLNLYIHDTHASGIGCDHLVDSQIIGCTVVGAGRQNNGTQPGGAGIGIGTGKHDYLGLQIVGNTCSDAATHGIFVEHQPGISTRTRGIEIVGNHCRLNRYGISDWGADGLIVIGNTLISNTVWGFGISNAGVAGFAGHNGIVSTNVLQGNGTDGIRLGDGVVGYMVSTNQVLSGTGNGIRVVNTSGSTANTDLIIDNNRIASNTGDGIELASPTNRSRVSDNTLRSNGGNGLLVSSTHDDLTLKDNRASGNTGYGLSNTGTITKAHLDGNNWEGNTAGTWANSGSLTLFAGPVRKANTGTLSPSATANTDGTAVDIFASLGKTWFSVILGIVANFTGTFGSETATLTVTAFFNNGTSASTTITSTATANLAQGEVTLRNLTGDGRAIQFIRFAMKSTISASAATCNVDVRALQE